MRLRVVRDAKALVQTRARVWKGLNRIEGAALTLVKPNMDRTVTVPVDVQVGRGQRGQPHERVLAVGPPKRDCREWVDGGAIRSVICV